MQEQEKFWILKNEEENYVVDEIVTLPYFEEAKRFKDRDEVARFLLHNRKYEHFQLIEVMATYQLKVLEKDNNKELNDSKMSVPVSVLFDKSLWIDYCEITGTNSWAVNEGLLDKTDNVELTIRQAKEIGLI